MTYTKKQRGDDDEHLMIFVLLLSAEMRIAFHRHTLGLRLICVFFIQSKYFTLRCQKGKSTTWNRPFWDSVLLKIHAEVSGEYSFHDGKWRCIIWWKKGSNLVWIHFSFSFFFFSFFLRPQAENHWKRWTNRLRCLAVIYEQPQYTLHPFGCILGQRREKGENEKKKKANK